MIQNIAAYHFTAIEQPQVLAAQLRAWAECAALRGTILVAPEGINLFLAGAEAGIHGFLELLRGDPRFADIAVKFSGSHQQPFARLKVKCKAQIIPFRHEQASPLSGRAPSVAPSTLARWLQQGQDDGRRPLLLLDTRNREEVAYGRFTGALTLAIDNFTDLPDAVMAQRERLRDATVVSYCTGGIRCEKAALWLQAQGLDSVLQLDGGILAYFEQVGGYGYDGDCFVFDQRVALDAQLRPLVDQPQD